MPPFLAIRYLVIGLLLLAGPARAATTTVTLPLRLDYPLIRAIFVQQAFTAAHESAVISNDPEGCLYLKLQGPEISAENNLLLFKARLHLRTGIPVLNSCGLPIELNGRVEILLKIGLESPGWTLHFHPQELRFTNLDGESSILTAKLVEIIKGKLFTHLNQVTVDLSPPLQELQETLPLFFQTAGQEKIQKWLGSMRAGTIAASPEFLAVDLLLAVESEPPALPPSPAAPLSAPEKAAFLQKWELWDSFLIYQLNHLALLNLDHQDRATALRTLLEARYQLVSFLASDRPAPLPDLVRSQFITTWSRLAPLFRKYLGKEPAVAPLSFLAFLAAGDALSVLDKVGPSLGLEISQVGLTRLARLLAVGEAPVTLDYSSAVDPALRKNLGFGPPLTIPVLEFPEEELEIEPLPQPGSWLHDLAPPAFAGPPSPAARAALSPWIINSTNFESNLHLVRAHFREVLDHLVADGPLPAARRHFFATLIQATAWQESCFRQFIVKNGKMTYLRSGNRSSVGLMQVNERVWRGFYQIEALRWSPRYNIQAGSEIVQMYLSDYAIPQKTGQPLNEEGLARATYALYNSGPQAFADFLGRHARRHYSSSDKLFWDKYLWTKAEEFEKLKTCFLGN